MLNHRAGRWLQRVQGGVAAAMQLMESAQTRNAHTHTALAPRPVDACDSQKAFEATMPPARIVDVPAPAPRPPQPWQHARRAATEDTQVTPPQPPSPPSPSAVSAGVVSATAMAAVVAGEALHRPVQQRPIISSVISRTFVNTSASMRLTPAVAPLVTATSFPEAGLPNWVWARVLPQLDVRELCTVAQCSTQVRHEVCVPYDGWLGGLRLVGHRVDASGAWMWIACTQLAAAARHEPLWRRLWQRRRNWFSAHWLWSKPSCDVEPACW